MSKNNFTEEDYYIKKNEEKKRQREEKKFKDALANLDYDKLMSGINKAKIRKRSVGVTIIGMFIILAGALILFYSVFMYFIINIPSAPRFTLFLIFGLFTYLSKEGYIFWAILSNLVGMIYSLSGINILRLKNWGRVLVIYCSTIVLAALLIFTYFKILPFMDIPAARLVLVPNFILPVFLPNVLFFLIFIYFFTRPKVKEQFK